MEDDGRCSQFWGQVLMVVIRFFVSACKQDSSAICMQGFQLPNDLKHSKLKMGIPI